MNPLSRGPKLRSNTKRSLETITSASRRLSFMLKPTGFFDRNPTLDVPAPGQAPPRRGAMSACSDG
jgi:hypothetical protein